MSAPDTVAYEMTVRGHLDDHWSGRLGGFSITRAADGTSTLTGTADQAQLHGVLTGLRDVGVELLHLNPVDPASQASALSRPLHTDRLTLRPATLADVETTWNYRRLDEVNEWLTGCPDTPDGYRDLFTRPDRLATNVIVELHDGTTVGDFMLRRHDTSSQTDVSDQAAGQQVELGWVLDPAHTGRGYATEAVHELLRHSFEDLGAHRVTANCFLANEVSWRLMERLGMRREAHTRRDALHRTGEWLDSPSYALLADEWPIKPRPDALRSRTPEAEHHPPSKEMS
jgi:RimJ/RimL family protein N-acetyltransferase